MDAVDAISPAWFDRSNQKQTVGQLCWRQDAGLNPAHKLDQASVLHDLQARQFMGVLHFPSTSSLNAGLPVIVIIYNALSSPLQACDQQAFQCGTLRDLMTRCSEAVGCGAARWI